MDWISVARMIAPLAPALGGVLGGFIPIPGGALAGQALGNVIARSLGVPATPDAVAGAVGATANDVLVAKLNAAAEEARAQWPAFAQAEQAYFEAQAKIAESVNVTMRAESSPDQRHWFYTGWRPAAGWLFVLFAASFGVLLIVAGARAAFMGKPEALKALTDAWPIFAAYFGALAAMVGVYIVGRSSEKAKAIEVAATPIVPLPKAKPR